MEIILTFQQKETSTAVITPLSQDVIEVFFKEHIEVGIREMVANEQALKSFVGEGRYCIMYVLPRESTFTREARALSHPNGRASYTKAEAVVLQNLAMKLMADFYYKEKPPVFPWKLFKKPEEAMQWLREQA